MLAKDVMSDEIISIRGAASVKDAIALFQESALHEFPVVDQQGKPIGIVTARSILRHAVPRYASSELLAVMRGGPDIESLYKNLEADFDDPVNAVIDEDFQVVEGDTPASAVAAILTNLGGDTNNLLVVDHAGALIGIISARDIICRLPEMVQL
jgi:CBS-domain-containing membrane protein